MKPVKIKFNFREIIARIASVLKARFGAVLLGLFFLSVAAWALIFWYYGIEISYTKHDAEIKIVKVRERDLRKILDDINARETAQNAAFEKIIPNPFIKPAEAP